MDLAAWTRPRVGAAALLALALLAYLPAIRRGGFVWDDDDHVTANPTLRSAEGLRRIWLEPGATPQYYPLVHTTFWIERRVWGLEPFGYRLVNVLLHATAALLLWRVLRRFDVPFAWFAAALFTVHPVHAESVAWITERKNVLSGVFYLGAASLASRVLLDGGDRRRDYLLACLLFLLALLSKTVTATLPLALGVVVWWKRGRLTARDGALLVPFLLAGALFAAITVMLERHHVGASGEAWSLTFAERVLVAGRAVWFYAGKLSWPRGLTFIYPRWDVNAAAWGAWAWPIAAAGAAAALWALRRRMGRGPLAAAAYFAVTLAPALGFVNVYPMRFSFVADHFQYLASAGPFALLAAGLGAWTAARRAPAARRAGPAAAALALGILAALTWRRGAAFEDEAALWRDTLRRNPGCWLAHNNLGSLLTRRGELTPARAHLEEAVRLDPREPRSLCNLGQAYEQGGDIGRAADLYGRALAAAPADAQAHYNLGVTLERGGDLAGATRHYRAAVRADPGFARAHNNLANRFAAEGRVAAALRHYAEAVRLDPEYGEAHGNYGALLGRFGRGRDAVSHGRMAVRLRPDLPETHLALGSTLLGQDRWVEAEACLAAALRLSPGHEAALGELGRLRLKQGWAGDAASWKAFGLALARAGRAEEARTAFERGAALAPRDAEIHNNLGVVLGQLGRFAEAVAHVEKALAMRPDYPEARVNLERLTRERGRGGK